jgi:cell division protein FtsB
MKYSLRSLMRFSIRDLFWIIALAAVLTAWWLDRRQLSQVIEKQNLEAQEVRAEIVALHANVTAEAKAFFNSLPTSSAPATNAPNP